MRYLLSCFSALLPFVSPCHAQAPAPLSESGTKMLVGRFGASEHWVQKGVIILSLNEWWHPAGTEMLVQALQDRDRRLRAFAIEALFRCDDELLPTIATPVLLEELITKQVGDSNEHFRGRVEQALHRLVPGVDGEGKSVWSKWWREHEDTHAPAPWQPREQPKAGEEGTSAVAQRAFDLYQYGLDMMLCLDSTGSMQPTIDALAIALGEMVDILDGISPKLRLGVVHYKDYGELGKGGAKVVQPLGKNIKSARKKLEKLRAHGGNDIPEAVLGGLDLTLSKAIKWKPDANKIAIVIGDAPPHPDDKARLIELARAAHQRPGEHGLDNKGKPTTGAGAKGPKQSPFLTSAIGVFVDKEAGLELRGWNDFKNGQDQMRKDFKELAAAGGGVFVEVRFQLTKADLTGSSKQRKKNEQAAAGIASQATKTIVEHILVLSFGPRFEREMHAFVEIYFTYKEADWFR